MATISVGVDGSSSAHEALRFAVAEARLREARLRVVAAWTIPLEVYGGNRLGPGLYPSLDPGMYPHMDPAMFERFARDDLDAALAALGDQTAGIEIQRVVREGQPTQVLLDQSLDVDMLVVGARGHGGFGGLLLGSVGHQCTMYAPCPVVVVHEPAAPPPATGVAPPGDARAARDRSGPVVVGVDGSPGSQAALDFAFTEAAMRDRSVQVVSTWQYPVLLGGGFAAPVEQYQTDAAHAVKNAIALAVHASGGGPTPPVGITVEHGHPAERLLAAAEDAALLVVGSRGHGGFVDLLLGSTSQSCVTHATCPVVVVPESPRDGVSPEPTP